LDENSTNIIDKPNSRYSYKKAKSDQNAKINQLEKSPYHDGKNKKCVNKFNRDDSVPSIEIIDNSQFIELNQLSNSSNT
jgi:hypothetical protein